MAKTKVLIASPYQCRYSILNISGTERYIVDDVPPINFYDDEQCRDYLRKHWRLSKIRILKIKRLNPKYFEYKDIDYLKGRR